MSTNENCGETPSFSLSHSAHFYGMLTLKRDSNSAILNVYLVLPNTSIYLYELAREGNNGENERNVGNSEY